MAQEARQQGTKLQEAGDKTGAEKHAGLMQENLQHAQDEYNEVIKRDPGNIDAVASLADLRFKTTGEVDDFTTRLYQATFAAQPDNYRVGYMYGIGLWLQDKKAEAKAVWADLDKRVPAGSPYPQMFAALKDMFGIKPETASAPAPKP
jgi:cytochrome c-type biogenesis protein CcmH/NrfG